VTIPQYWQQAVRELARSDAVLKRLIRQYRGLAPRSRGDAFVTLARAIVGQQISVKAADSVWQRLGTTLDTLSPHTVGTASVEMLRSCGLSARKADYVRDLAAHFIEGGLAAARWEEFDDETLIARLVEIRGIGRWTAEMFLMFHLARPDVLPLDDLGLQRALRLHYNNGRPLSPRRVRAITRQWEPWRSVATWYLWRSLDPLPVDY
jgi:DNA-3-methyladenine glycosylase II